MPMTANDDAALLMTSARPFLVVWVSLPLRKFVTTSWCLFGGVCPCSRVVQLIASLFGFVLLKLNATDCHVIVTIFVLRIGCGLWHYSSQRNNECEGDGWMWWRFWPGRKKGITGPVYYPPVKLSFSRCPSAASANDNCFFKWMFGPIRPFETANFVRKLRDEILADPDYFLADKAELLDHSNTFLALFRAVYIDEDLEQAKALAPRLNRHVPDLMARCPIKSLRPDQFSS